jgi:hypothetical protein
VEKLCDKRGWRDPVDVRVELKLVLEDTDNPELYDFRLCSGVVRDEDGVTLLRGIKDGEVTVARVCVSASAAIGSGCGVGGVDGIGGAGAIDSLFILRTSVGLIVLAASPVA